MNNMEPSSIERRLEENIRQNREFQMPIGLTRIAKTKSPPEKKFRHDYVKHKVEAASGRSTRMEKKSKTKWNRNDKMQKSKQESATNTVIKFIAKLAHFLMQVP